MKSIKERSRREQLNRNRSSSANLLRTARRWVITERALDKAEQEWKQVQDRMRARYQKLTGCQEKAEKILRLMECRNRAATRIDKVQRQKEWEELGGREQWWGSRAKE
eukprot:2686808-Alexandrium_andersonii.AAC.1